MKRSDTRRRRLPFGLDRLRLRFSEPALEAAFREDRFQNNITNIRFAFLAGIAVWIAWGVLLRPHMLALAEGSSSTTSPRWRRAAHRRSPR